MTNPYTPWMWVALVATQAVVWPVVLIAGSWWGFAGYAIWAASIILALTWERRHPV